jgi:DNA-binding MarR family transcriptional regulator
MAQYAASRNAGHGAAAEVEPGEPLRNMPARPEPKQKHVSHGERTVATIDHNRYVPFLIISISNGLYRGASQFYQAKFGIGVTEWRVLSALAAEPKTTANRLCQIAQLDKAAASRSLRVLEMGGYVTIAPHATDARKRMVAFTPSGFALYEKILGVALKRQDRMVAGLSQEEINTLISLLQRVRSNIARLEE